MTCATLYMISQLLVKDTLRASSFQPNMKKEGVDVKVEPSQALSAALLEDDSEDEHYDDVPLEDVSLMLRPKTKVIIIYFLVCDSFNLYPFPLTRHFCFAQG